MRDMLKVIATGRLGHDPEVRFTASGLNVANFSIACNQSKKQGNDWIEYPEWLRCTVFGKLADIVDEYCKKGDKILIEGRLQTDKYTDREGVERTATKIIVDYLQMISTPREDGAPAQQRAPRQQSTTRQESPQQRRDPAPGFDQDPDEDIPF